MKPETTAHILPSGLLIGAIVCGGICWLLEGTAFWVMMVITIVLLVAGIVVAMRTEAARRDK